MPEMVWPPFIITTSTLQYLLYCVKTSKIAFRRFIQIVTILSVAMMLVQ